MKPAVDTAQTTWELEQLLVLVNAQGPLSILEIGVWEGGTLWHWLQHADTVTAIDDTMRNPGPGVWQTWADDAHTDLHLIQGKSQDPDVIVAAAKHARYDLLFIDGDHTYDSVKADWVNYWPMVAEGGLVAFHDITTRPEYGVSELWGEIKSDHCAVEIVDGSGRFNGIGVVWL